MSEAQNKLNVNTIFDDKDEVKFDESLPPPLIRRKASTIATLLSQKDQVLLNDIVGGELDEMLESQTEKQEISQNTGPKTIKEEFFNVQQGLMAIFYQNEHHTKILMEKLVELLERLTVLVSDNETNALKMNEVIEFLR